MLKSAILSQSINSKHTFIGNNSKIYWLFICINRDKQMGSQMRAVNLYAAAGQAVRASLSSPSRRLPLRQHLSSQRDLKAALVFDGQLHPSLSGNGSQRKQTNVNNPWRTHSWVGGRSFLALGLLLVVFSVFTGFTSVGSHCRWSSSSARLTCREAIGRHRSGAAHSPRPPDLRIQECLQLCGRSLGEQPPLGRRWHCRRSSLQLYASVFNCISAESPMLF